MRSLHPFSPSRLGRRHRCAGSYREEQRAAALPMHSTPEADEGTRLHAAIARALTSWSLEGLSDEDAELVTRAYEYAMRHGVGEVGGHVERDVVIRGREGRVLSVGRADLIIPRTDGTRVIDFKFGHVPLDEVDAAFQAAAYVAGACDSEDSPVGFGYLYMPRLDREYAQRVDIPEAVERIEETVDACLKPDAPLVPGSWCSYCTACGLCPATQQAVATAPEKLPTLADVNRLPAAGLAKSLQLYRELLKPIGKAIEARARTLLEENPDSVPGWRLNSQNGQRHADPGALYEAVKDVLTLDEYLACTSVSVAQVEQALDAKKEKLEPRGLGIVTQPKIKQLRRSKT